METLDIRQMVGNHLIDVFDTMLGKKAVPLEDKKPPHFAARVTGSVGFAGETVNGGVYLHLSESFAKAVAAAMLGTPAGEPLGEAEVNDVIGEAANMLAGGLKSALCDAGAPCAVSTPSIIRGNSFVVEPLPDVKCISLLYECEKEPVFVEVHIKTNT